MDDIAGLIASSIRASDPLNQKYPMGVSAEDIEIEIAGADEDFAIRARVPEMSWSAARDQIIENEDVRHPATIMEVMYNLENSFAPPPSVIKIFPASYQSAGKAAVELYWHPHQCLSFWPDGRVSGEVYFGPTP